MTRILDGKAMARDIRAEVAAAVQGLKQSRGIVPGLAVILVGDDPASAVYIRNKERACGEVGISTQTFSLSGQISQDELISLIHTLNHDVRFHGILVQLPLPLHIQEWTILAAIDPFKDIDGLHPVNVGKLALGIPEFVPCTPLGIQQMLLRSGYDITGKEVVICGRSSIVGRPLSILLSQKTTGGNATTTICHSATQNLAEVTRRADILVAAIGQPEFITMDMVKDGAIVIDVGVNRLVDPTHPKGYRLVGDVDFENLREKIGAITPVPGGVGPMTVAMLLVNTVKATQSI